MAQEAQRVDFSLGEPSESQPTYTEEVDSEASDFKTPSDNRTSNRKDTATEDPGAFLVGRRQRR